MALSRGFPGRPDLAPEANIMMGRTVIDRGWGGHVVGLPPNPWTGRQDSSIAIRLASRAPLIDRGAPIAVRNAGVAATRSNAAIGNSSLSGAFSPSNPA